MKYFTVHFVLGLNKIIMSGSHYDEKVSIKAARHTRLYALALQIYTQIVPESHLTHLWLICKKDVQTIGYHCVSWRFRLGTKWLRTINISLSESSCKVNCLLGCSLAICSSNIFYWQKIQSGCLDLTVDDHLSVFQISSSQVDFMA